MDYELIDVTDLIIPEDEPNYFNDDEALELYQTCSHLMEEFIRDNPQIIADPDFDEIFDENVYELMHAHFDFDVFYNEDAEEEMNEIIHHAKTDFFNHFIPPRSYSTTFIINNILLNPESIDFIEKQIAYLKSKPQPEQRTKEWYEFRYNLITASNAYKAFENQTTQNQLIYEKCSKLNYNDDANVKEVVVVNVNTSLHWGQKYEPVSVELYELLYNTKVGSFGCIQHDKYGFLGASPDGINIDKTSPRYGRMLEIKNIVNREINGIPKKEYWIQMQLQMEVCDLNECDFLETQFIEYPDFDSYKADTEAKFKSEIIHFHTKEGSPFYVYKPINCVDDNWSDEIVSKYENEYMFMKTIYWKLEQMSCVLVCRNKLWFKESIPVLQNIWSIIEKERISGCEHRAPIKRLKKETEDTIINNNITGCFLKYKQNFMNIVKLEPEQDLELELDPDLDS
jgi:putative phage-type endonuclease